MMNERAQLLLKILVERYIADGQPVGSRTLSKTSGLDLSPATIRNVMTDLEEMGLVASPHVSAGRIPTPKGYRLFVDTMLTAEQSKEGFIRELRGNINLPKGQPKEVLTGAANLLSELSSFAGIITSPKHNSAIRQVDFLRLSARRILVIIVSLGGEVQNRIIHTQKDYEQDDLLQAANYINTHFKGLQLTQVKTKLGDEIETLRSEIVELMRSAVDASTDNTIPSPDEQLVVSGERNLLEINDLAGDLESLRKLFEVFEQKTQWLQLLDVSEKAEGVRIFIGGESHIVPIDELSVVTAPYEINGQVVGQLGVIGPVRMAYDRMIQIVDITARLVGNALSYTNETDE